MKAVKSAIFPVAGYGTRMLPATKAIPKEMLTLVDKPLIQYGVEEAIASGIEQIIFITGKSKKALEDHFDINHELNKVLQDSGKSKLYEDVDRISKLADIVYIRQKEQLGLGHAILCAKDIVRDEPFAVILPDDIILSDTPVTAQLLQQYNQTGGDIISLMKVAEERAKDYGIVGVEKELGNGLLKLSDMEEKPSGKPISNLAIIGRYILTHETMGILKSTKPGKNGEIQLTDAIRQRAKEADVYGYEFEGKRFDCGNRVGLLEATLNFAKSNKELSPELDRLIAELYK